MDASSAAAGGIKCFSCRKLKHKASECFSRVQDRNARRNSCNRCEKIGHTFMQCEKRNRSSHGGASAHKRAFKVECALPVRKFNTIEDDKQEEDRCKNKSDDKENTCQKSEDYLELKDRKKIQVLNGACLKDSISISISISILYFCSATIKTERNKQTYRTIAAEEKGRSNKTLNVIAAVSKLFFSRRPLKT